MSDTGRAPVRLRCRPTGACWRDGAPSPRVHPDPISLAAGGAGAQGARKPPCCHPWPDRSP